MSWGGAAPRDPTLQRQRRKRGRWDRGGETTPGETLSFIFFYFLSSSRLVDSARLKGCRK